MISPEPGIVHAESLPNARVICRIAHMINQHEVYTVEDIHVFRVLIRLVPTQLPPKTQENMQYFLSTERIKRLEKRMDKTG
jgi:hypothetical protein